MLPSGSLKASKRPPRDPKSTPRGPKDSQESPKIAKTRPSGPSQRPRRHPRWSKTPQGDPQELPRGSQEAPKRLPRDPQEVSERSQRGPRRHPMALTDHQMPPSSFDNEHLSASATSSQPLAFLAFPGSFKPKKSKPPSLEASKLQGWARRNARSV